LCMEQGGGGDGEERCSVQKESSHTNVNLYLLPRLRGRAGCVCENPRPLGPSARGIRRITLSSYLKEDASEAVIHHQP
jgi:hypothetical protein